MTSPSSSSCASVGVHRDPEDRGGGRVITHSTDKTCNSNQLLRICNAQTSAWARQHGTGLGWTANAVTLVK